ncbi:MAG: hypothetical protein ACYSR1_09515, partial [Planctomycetota bacterium]
MSNPTVLPSGFLGTSKSLLKRVADNGVGAATIKSVSFEAREGHKNPTVIPFEGGMLNAVGYSNPGAEETARISYALWINCQVMSFRPSNFHFRVLTHPDSGFWQAREHPKAQKRLF